MKSTLYHPRCCPWESCHIQAPCDTSGRRTTSLTRTIQTKSSSRPPDKDPIEDQKDELQRRPDPDRVEADELQRRPDPQVADEYQDEADDADPARVEAGELQRGPDHQRANRMPTCHSPAARVQNPGLPDHSQFHLFPFTPAHYRFNAHRPTDFPRMEDLRGWIGVPHYRNHAPIPIPNRERLSPRKIGILQVLWDLNLGNERSYFRRLIHVKWQS